MPATEGVAGWVLSHPGTKSSVRFFVTDGLVVREDRDRFRSWYLTETGDSQRNAVTATAAYESAGYTLDGSPVIVPVLVKDLLILRKCAVNIRSGGGGSGDGRASLPGATTNRLVKGLQSARFPSAGEE